MRQGVLDLMIEFSANALASENLDDVRRLVRDLAERWPEAPALSISFSITTAAASLEAMVHGPKSKGFATEGYRLAALVAADVLAIESMGQAPAKGHHLLQFWRRVDPFFLDL